MVLTITKATFSTLSTAATVAAAASSTTTTIMKSPIRMKKKRSDKKMKKIPFRILQVSSEDSDHPFSHLEKGTCTTSSNSNSSQGTSFINGTNVGRADR